MAKLGVFVSWSGERSKLYARHITDWLPSVLPNVEPWVSDKDIKKGERWNQVVGQELAQKQVGIFCVTPENLSSRWLYFEAGALSKAVGEAKVFPLLFAPRGKDAKKAMIDDLDHGPLGQFQATEFEKEEMLAFTKSLNQQLPEGDRIREDVLKQNFERIWPELSEKVAKVAPPPSLVRLPMMSNDDLLALEKRASEARQRGLLIIVNSREPVEANSPAAAKVVLSNIEAGVEYDYFFDRAEGNVGFAADLVQTLSIANKLDTLMPSPPQRVRLIGEHAPDVEKTLTELLLGRVRIHFRNETPFHFCIHNAITLGARCYLRYDAGLNQGFVEWYSGDFAKFAADELRKSRIEQSPVALRSRIFHSTRDCDIDADRSADYQASWFKDLLHQAVRDRFPRELEDLAWRVCFQKAKPSQVAAS